MIIVVDAGHGYKQKQDGSIVWDPGAIGYLNGVRYEEARVAAQYALSLGYHLRLYDPSLQLSLLMAHEPSQALTLQSRRRHLPQARAFVSIHCNAAAHANASGYETLYSRAISLPLAEVCHAAMRRAFEGRLDRGVKTQGLTVCLRQKPAVLMELGFVTNPSDLEYLLLRETRARWAREVARALLEFLS